MDLLNELYIRNMDHVLTKIFENVGFSTVKSLTETNKTNLEIVLSNGVSRKKLFKWRNIMNRQPEIDANDENQTVCVPCVKIKENVIMFSEMKNQCSWLNIKDLKEDVGKRYLVSRDSMAPIKSIDFNDEIVVMVVFVRFVASKVVVLNRKSGNFLSIFNPHQNSPVARVILHGNKLFSSGAKQNPEILVTNLDNADQPQLITKLFVEASSYSSILDMKLDGKYLVALSSVKIAVWKNENFALAHLVSLKGDPRAFSVSWPLAAVRVASDIIQLMNLENNLVIRQFQLPNHAVINIVEINLDFLVATDFHNNITMWMMEDLVFKKNIDSKKLLKRTLKLQEDVSSAVVSHPSHLSGLKLLDNSIVGMTWSGLRFSWNF